MIQSVQKTKQKRYIASVRMVKPRSDVWLTRPTRDNVLESLCTMIRSGEIDDLFEITVEEK